MKKYCFVDFAAHYQKGFRNHIVKIHEVPGLIEKYKAYECFSTYFFYTDEIFAYMTAHAPQGHPSISGYHGKIWAPFLPFDIDAPAVENAHEIVKLIAGTLIDKWRVPRAGCHFYFSGSKGFHVMLDTRLFGKVAATQHLHQIFSTLREKLIYAWPDFDRSSVDLTIKDTVRLLRLPNTVNAKSGLYKIGLDYEQVMGESTAKILDLAKKPCTLKLTDETGYLSTAEVFVHPKLSTFFNQARRWIRRFTRKPFDYHFSSKFGSRPEDFLCPGYLKIWQSHVEPGLRNNCGIRLLSEFRLNGLDKENAKNLILEWNKNQNIGLSEHELQHTVNSAYAPPFPYRYGCHDMIAQKFCSFGDYRRCQEWERSRKSKKENDGTPRLL